MWEELPTFDTGNKEMHSARMSVPGGWIVSTIAETGSHSGGISVSQIFIEDIAHEWQLMRQPADRLRKAR